MMLHPDKLKNAQEELDRVVGMDRMPTISDREDLPYLGAVIKETMRWHPTVPLSQLADTIRQCMSWADVRLNHRSCSLHSKRRLL